MLVFLFQFQYTARSEEEKADPMVLARRLEGLFQRDVPATDRLRACARDLEFELCLLPSASSVEFTGLDKPRITSLYGVANATRRVWLKARELSPHQHALSLLARHRGPDETTPATLTISRTQRDGPYARAPLLDRCFLSEPPMDPRRLHFNDRYALLLKQNEVTFFEAMYCVLGLDRRISGLNFRRRKAEDDDEDAPPDTSPEDDSTLLLSAGRNLDRIAWVPQKRYYRETQDAVIVLVTPPASPPPLIDFAAEPQQPPPPLVAPSSAKRGDKKKRKPSELDPDRIVDWARSSLRSDALQEGSCLSACVTKRRRGAPRKVAMNTVVALVDRIVAESLGASSQPEKSPVAAPQPHHVLAEASDTEALATASSLLLMAPLPPSEFPSFGLLEEEANGGGGGEDDGEECRIGILSDSFSPLPPFTPSAFMSLDPATPCP